MPQPGTSTQPTEITQKVARRKGSKNIVLCFDGTGNEIRAKGNTNVVRLFRALENTTGEQVTYYDPGVGTFSSAGASTRVGQRISRTLGLAFGVGIKTNLAEAYTFLMKQWEPGDRIYLFGFSRGAHTARAFAAMLHLVGLPRASSENLVQYAIAAYARRRSWDSDDFACAEQFATTVCRASNGTFSVPVHYLGIWDSVSAPGIFEKDYHFEKTAELPNVESGRHAISIDEYRRPYRVDKVANDRIEEVWFSGVHSDVGGGFEDCRLADISLRWVLEGALDHGVLLRRTVSLRQLPKPEQTSATATPTRMSRIWWLIGRGTREILGGTRSPEGLKVHESVRLREDRLAARLRNPHWVDPEWYTPKRYDLEVSGYTNRRTAPLRPDRRSRRTGVGHNSRERDNSADLALRWRRSGSVPASSNARRYASAASPFRPTRASNSARATTYGP
ncbi:DUF2235 domain-containing protein [Rhodococcus rhodochrous]|nr:DUF2235 domain-containing protein [Rhodococcus rhodochrous]